MLEKISNIFLAVSDFKDDRQLLLNCMYRTTVWGSEQDLEKKPVVKKKFFWCSPDQLCTKLVINGTI